MNGLRLLVGAFIISTFVVWLAFDAWLGPNGGPTESQVLAYWSQHLTSFSFLMGSLFGHWFLGRRSANYSSWFYPFIGIVSLTAWDIYFLNTHGFTEPWYRSNWIWLGLGLPAGSIFWPQQDPESPIT